MLGWALAFLIIALTAGVLGFGGVAVISANVAKVLFVVFILLFAVALVVSAIKRRPPR